MTTDNIFQIGWAVLLALGYVRDWFSMQEGKR